MKNQNIPYILILLSFVIIQSCNNKTNRTEIDYSNLYEDEYKTNNNGTYDFSKNPRFPFLNSISSGSSGLDDSIKTMILLRWKGNFEKELDWTYKPALDLLYGNEAYQKGKNGSSLPYYKDKDEYLKKQKRTYESRDRYIDECSYIPIISKELFSAKADNFEVRCYNASVVISMPDNKDAFKIKNVDIVCFNDGKWSFYLENFPSHDLYLHDRIDVLLSFLENKGISSNDRIKIKGILKSYSGCGYQYLKYLPQNKDEKDIVNNYNDMTNIIIGKKNGSIRKYVYTEGFRKILGYDLSDSELKQMYSETEDYDMSEISILPYKLKQKEVLNPNVKVYTLNSITCKECDRDIGSILKSKTMCIKFFNENCWKFITIYKDNEMEELLTEMFRGVLKKDEIHSIIY